MDQNQNFRINQAGSNSGVGTERRSAHELSLGSANDPLYRAAVNAAKTRVHRAAITAGLTPSEREDLCQEILLDIYERKGQFDPMRGAPGTFTGLVSAHCTAEFLNARKADRQKLIFSEPEHIDTFDVIAIDRVIHGLAPTKNAANDEDGGSPGSMLLEDVATCWGVDIDLFSNSDAQHDLIAALEYMSSEQHSLFDLLVSHQNLPAAAKVSGMSSATFYRRVDELRMHLRMFGIRPAA